MRYWTKSLTWASRCRKHGIVKDEKFFAAAITAKTAHFLEASGRLLAQLAFFDCDCPHGDCGNSTHTRSTCPEIMIHLMCGRYRLSRRKQLVEEYFDASGEEDWSPRYNIAPTQHVAVVRQRDNSERELSLLRWGLIPAWASDPSLGLKTINARSGTVTTTASFSQPVRSQRCLVPADGFYEWKRTGKAKQPYCFEVGEGAIFAFAGLWDRWIDPQGKAVETCTILTTTPNTLLSDIHDRMPVILNPADYEVWLTSAVRKPY